MKYLPSIIWRKKPLALLELTAKAIREQVTHESLKQNALQGISHTRSVLKAWGLRREK